MIDQKQFEKHLTLIGKKGQELQTAIHEAAIYALQTVNLGKTVGQTSPIQRLWNTVAPIKAINPQAFMSWAQEFGALRFVKTESEGFVVKYVDKTKKDSSFDPAKMVAEAEATPFWTFAKDPNPNTKPYDVMSAMSNIIQSAKSAKMGGKNGDKPKRVIEHENLLGALEVILGNPAWAMERLNLDKPSDVVQQDNQEVAAPRSRVLKAA